MPAVVAFALYDWHYFFAQLIAGLTLGSLYALLALGYTMVYGILKLLNFAHGDVYMIGAYIGYFVLTALGGAAAPKVPTGLLILLMFGAAMVGGAVLGVVIERFAYRPLRRAPRIAPLISALGVSFFLQQTAVLLFGPIPKEYNPYALHGGELFNTVAVGNFRIQYVQIFVIVSAVVLMVALTVLVRRTTVGKAMRATSFDLEAASMMGIDVDRVIAFTFLVGEWVARSEDRLVAPRGVPERVRQRIAGIPQWALFLAFVVTVALIPVLTNDQYVLRVATDTMLYVLLAAGLNVAVGWAGILDLGYIAFYGFAAYLFAELSSPHYGLHWPTWASVPVVIVGTIMLGFLLALTTRRLSGYS